MLNQFLNVPSATPDNHRRARLLNVILGGVISLAAITLVIVAIGQLIGVYTQEEANETHIPTSIILVSSIAVFIINRYWSVRIAGFLFLLISTAVFYLNNSPFEAIWGRNMIMLVFPILLASLIFQPSASFLMAGVVGILLFVSAILNGIEPNIIGILAYFAIALTPWLLSRTLERAIRDLRITNRNLQHSEERYAAAARGANDGLWDWDLDTNKIYFSPRWTVMLGYDESDIGDTPEEWFKRVHPDDRQTLEKAIDTHIRQETAHFVHEYRVKHRDGAYRWMLCRGLAVRDAEGRAHRMAGSQTDITRRKAAEDQLLHDTFHDTLTQLPNRTLFLNHLTRVIDHTRRQPDHLFAVLLLDPNRFQIINNSLGHATGDQFLIALGQRLKNAVRAGDMVARIAGDKFAILLDGLEDTTEAGHLAQKIQIHGAMPITLDGQEVSTTASIGLVLGQNTLQGRTYNQAEEVLRDADTALNQAKAQGPATVTWFDPNMHTQIVARMALETELRLALKQRQFQLYYQPIVSASSGKITGTEVLLRWQHPRRGLIRPAEFFPALEETGIIIPVGQWMLRAVCMQIMRWRKAGYNLRGAVNLSARQLQDKNLLRQIKITLTEEGVPPNALELEITETIAMQNIALSLTLLNQLKSLGLGISIDDFGTGYSSLTRLKQLPVNTLKIDKSFIKDVTFNKDDAAITSAIIAMGRRLKLNLIAEGVETQEQLTFLQAQQCNEVQGYLFSQPVPADELTKLLAQKEQYQMYQP